MDVEAKWCGYGDNRWCEVVVTTYTASLASGLLEKDEREALAQQLRCVADEIAPEQLECE